MRPRIIPALLSTSAMALVGALGCGGGGGSSSGTSSTFELQTIRTESGRILPTLDVSLNERIVLVFSTEVDPSSVSPDSIRIRRRSIVGGQPSGMAFTVPALGDFVVRGREVGFVPRLPVRSDFEDAGFLPGTEYRIEVDAFPAYDSVRSRRGRPLPAPVITTFQTRSSAPLLRDPVPGPPSVLAVALDLDGDGVLEADGDAATIDPEEFFDFDRLPFLDDVPQGLARSPLAVGFVMSEPLQPSTLFQDSDRDGVPDKVFLVDASRDIRLPSRLRLVQDFLPAEDRFRVLIVLTPTSTLPTGARIQPTLLPGIQDFSFPPFDLGGQVTAFDTRPGPGHFDDAFVERFEDRENRDPNSTAEWNVNSSRALVAGSGIGGTGEDGELFVARDGFVTLDTDEHPGGFNFTTFFVDVGATLEVVGSNGLIIFTTSDATLAGTIDVSGLDGQSGATATPSSPARGAPGNAGGTAGGDAGVSRFVTGAGPLGMGGGEGGDTSGNPAGGGGGGHSRVGGSLFAPTNCGAGLGGAAYGNPSLRPLYAGSGGGGGGNVVDAGPFLGGGGGGAGGGAVSFDCGGTFTLTGILRANGGNGGLGATGSPFGGGGGAGGSGGSLRIKAATVAALTVPGTLISAEGGAGGRPGGGTLGFGGGGAPGRIYIETLDSNGDGQPNDFEVDTGAVRIGPPLARGIIRDSIGKTFALSKFLDTGASFPGYAFDASDPLTGVVRFSRDVNDLRFRGELPDTATVVIRFQGAREDPLRPRTLDASTITELTPRIQDLDGMPFIRYRIDFDIGRDITTAERPKIEELTVRFQFDV